MLKIPHSIRVGMTKQKDQIDNEIRLFCKSIVKTKHQRLTSLASFDSSRAPTEWSAIFAFGVCAGREVRIEKNCARGLEYGSRPQAEGRT